MTRRYRKQEPDTVIDMIFEIALMLPWWLDLSGCVITYFAFEFLKHYDMPSDPLGTELMSLFVPIVQYGLMIIFLLGGIVSGIKELSSRNKESPVQINLEINSTEDLIKNIGWEKFERLIGQYFKAKGFAVDQKGGPQADGGVDIELRKDGNLYLVQCKKWNREPVGVSIVRELHGVMTKRNATGAFLVASSYFTQDASAYAEGTHIELIDGNKLSQIMHINMPAVSFTDNTAQELNPAPLPARASNHPVCPLCSSPMTKRTAHRGDNSGKEFWGCSTYPKCRGVININ